MFLANGYQTNIFVDLALVKTGVCQCETEALRYPETNYT